MATWPSCAPRTTSRWSSCRRAQLWRPQSRGSRCRTPVSGRAPATHHAVMKSIPSLLIAAVFALLTFAVWAYLNRPTSEPPWPKVVRGFAFSHFRANEDPTHNTLPTEEEIDSDLALLQGKV